MTALSQEDLERIATFLREGGGVRRGRPKRKPEPAELEPDPVAEPDSLIQALIKEREVRGLDLRGCGEEVHCKQSVRVPSGQGHLVPGHLGRRKRHLLPGPAQSGMDRGR